MHDPVIVWLWDASGASSVACGISGDEASALEAAGACLVSGDATTAVVQAARLANDVDALDPHYVRFGSCWQARRVRNGAVSWREVAGQPPALAALRARPRPPLP